jgi:hypothetical protein
MNDETNKTDPLEILSDYVTEAHTRIQRDFSEINPVVGVSRKLRTVGIMADTMTIDCLKSGKRIIVVLHDDMPGIVRFQFSFIEQDPSDKFEEIQLQELTQNHYYNWMKDYFA